MLQVVQLNGATSDTHQQNLYLVDNLLDQKQLSVEDLDSVLPGYFHINRSENMSIIRMGNSGCSYLGRSETELIKLGPEFSHIFFDPYVGAEKHRRCSDYFQQAHKTDVHGHFEKVRRDEKSDFAWFLTTGKLSAQCNGILMISYPVSQIDFHAEKLMKLLDENQFMRKHYQEFASLTKRERDILERVARGQKRCNIAEQLSISVHTLDTHRKRIREKLSLNSMADLIRYAKAFGLIND